MSGPANQNQGPPSRLRVLPSGGKVEQLRHDPPAGAAAGEVRTSAPSPEQRALLEGVVEVLRTVYDPELPLNIYDLGLIYGIDVGDGGDVRVRMTLTTPACPVAGTLPGEVQRRVAAVEGVKSADVQLVWDPPWTKDRLSEAAKLELGLL
jgi:FeS assembly SUF system protein